MTDSIRSITRAQFATIARERGWEEQTIKLLMHPSTPRLPPITFGSVDGKPLLAVTISDWPVVTTEFRK